MSATTGRREATKERNRAAIVAAGREVFAELGYGAASVRDVIRRTGLAAGTFYNYFPDKESVFRAVLDESTRQLRTRLRAARGAETTFAGVVEAGYRELSASSPRTRRCSCSCAATPGRSARCSATRCSAPGSRNCARISRRRARPAPWPASTWTTWRGR